MTNDRKQSVLRVSFDADQISDQLYWRLGDGDPGDLTRPDGAYAGALRFYPGESLQLQVSGGGTVISGFSSFQIVDCCFITRPQVVYCEEGGKTRYAPPSPFLQAPGGSYPLALDFRAHLDELTGPDYRKVVQHWKRTLDIGFSSGRWELSFNLTVRIMRGADQGFDVRVFQFDPESEVGTGARPPQDLPSLPR
jgi:hypothetical protein